MRLSRKFRVILGIVIFAVVLGILFNTYSGQVAERDELSDRLMVAEGRLPGLTAEKGDLQKQLTQARSLRGTSQAKYPESVESIEYGEYLFEIAEKCNVTLASLSFPRPSDTKQGAVTYSVVSLSLPISGSLANIFEFIQTIRTDARFASTRVKSVSLGGGSATISVDIYGYKR